MKKKGVMGLLAAGLLVGLLLPASMPVLADTYEDAAQVQTLYAGQNIDVGTVKVWNDEDNLYVKYETTGGWAMTETHLEVKCSEADIPQGRKGNPKVGHFTYGDSFDPPEDEWLQTIDLDELCGTSLAIAAHAVVTDAPVGQATGMIYGARTAGGTKGLYEIDVANDTVTLLKAITGAAADVNNGTGYTNGLAYDPDSNKLYLTAPPRVGTSPTPLWSYDIDADALQSLGSLPGSVVSGSFYQGAYYYIAEGTNSLWKAELDGGPIAPVLVFSGFGVPSSFTFGDIAISSTGMLFGSTRVSPRMFFSLDLNSLSGDYQVFAGSNALDLQLAYGSNGILYGANHGNGKFYVVDEATGTATQQSLVASGFADLASGTLFVPRTETAWADGTRFVEKGNWATYIEYDVIDYQPGGVLYLIDNPDGDIYLVELDWDAMEADLTLVTEAPSGISAGHLGHAVDDDLIYAIDNSSATLGVYDVGAPFWTTSAMTGATPSSKVLVAMSPDGELFFAAQNDDLYRVDNYDTAPVATNVADINVDVSGADIAFASDGTLYLYSNATDKLYTLDPDTGVTTLLATHSGLSLTGLAVLGDGAGIFVIGSETNSSNLHVFDRDDGSLDYTFTMYLGTSVFNHTNGDMTIGQFAS
ncbi:hypothetical protein ACFLUT_00540 [Chloroflexota bacterium]